MVQANVLKGLTVLAVDAWGESASLVQQWQSSHHLPATLLIDPAMRVFQQYSGQGTPTTFFIDDGYRVTGHRAAVRAAVGKGRRKAMGFRWMSQERADERARAAAREYFVGVDLGQARDYTAIAIVQRVTQSVVPDVGEVQTTINYHLRHLERVELGTRYPAIIARVLDLLARPPLSEESPLVVDRTGVGAAVVDMFTAAGADPQAITIHGGDSMVRERRHHRVPKRDLVGTLIAIHQSGRLHTAAGLTLFPTLVNELVNFQLKVNIATGHDSYEAWRESVHDDLVLAVAMACWFAENEPQGITLADPALVAAMPARTWIDK